MMSNKTLAKKAERILADLETLKIAQIVRCPHKNEIDSAMYIAVEMLVHKTRRLMKVAEINARRNAIPRVDKRVVHRLRETYMNPLRSTNSM